MKAIFGYGLLNLLLIVSPAKATSVLVPAKTIQLQVDQNSVNLTDYKATAGVRCSYKAGLFWPESKSCGSRSLPVEINAQGQLVIPAVESFDQYKGGNIDNFDMSVTLVRKDNDRDWLFSFGVRGKNSFKNYQAETGTIHILKMDATEIEYSVEGQALVGSDLSQNPQANLLVSISSPYQPGDVDRVLLVTPLREIQSFDNRDHGYARESLIDFRTLKMKSAALVEFSNNPRKLELISTVMIINGGPTDSRFQSRIELNKSVDGLSQIRQIDLKKIN